MLAFVVPLGALAEAAGTAPSTRERTACGSELWSLKTLSDQQRRRVSLRPRDTTVRAINARRMPSVTPMRRDSFELQVWRVRAQIVQYKLEDDGDIHLILFDGGAYMIAEMPRASCLPQTTRARRAIAEARRLFEQRCGRAEFVWKDLGAVAFVSGVGFWDFPHGQSGHARNFAELHPVTGLRPLSGCGT